MMYFYHNNEHRTTVRNVHVDINIFTLFLILITPCLMSFVLYKRLIDFLRMGKRRVVF